MTWALSLWAGLAVLGGAGATRVTGAMMKAVDFVTSNVPGPPFPVFMSGARIERMFPFGPPAGATVNITLFSYDGVVHLGVTGEGPIAGVLTLIAQQVLERPGQSFQHAAVHRQLRALDHQLQIHRRAFLGRSAFGLGGMALGAVCSWLLALPTMRLSGLNYAVATLAFGEMARITFSCWKRIPPR